MTVLWNVTPRPLVGLVAAAAGQATLVDAFGTTSTIAPLDGWYRLLPRRGAVEHRATRLELDAGRWAAMADRRAAWRGRTREPAAAVADGLHFADAASAWRTAPSPSTSRPAAVGTFGPPISRELDLAGMPTQIFQRQVMRSHPTAEFAPSTCRTTAWCRTPGRRPTFPPPMPACGHRRQRGQRGLSRTGDYFVRQEVPDTWQGRQVNFGRMFFSTIRCEATAWARARRASSRC